MSLDRDVSALFTEGYIGALRVKNRFIRAATSETMATDDGRVTKDLIDLHTNLAKGEVGLQILGHAYVDVIGQYENNQTGIYDDGLIPGLTELTDAVHSSGGLIFAQLAFAGSQTKVRRKEALAPSPVTNPISGTTPRELKEEEIWKIISSFAKAANSAKSAHFDGVHIHGANGYLISEFNSPLTNQRTDSWGGSETKRSRFLFEVYEEVRRSVGNNYPVTLKLGIEDDGPGGLRMQESVGRALKLEAEGLNAIEVSCGIMHKPTSSAQKYVAVNSKRAISDLLVHRIFRKGAKESYFIEFARTLKKNSLKIPVILVGGIRSTQTMTRLLREGDADFLSLARPFIREPDLVRQIRNGRSGLVSCTSCNLCLDHEGEVKLMCWRKSKALLAKALVERLSS